MNLFIPDLFEVLKARVKKITHAKASQDPANVLAGVADIEALCLEIRAKANEQALEMEKLRLEDEAAKGD